jgi:uncharacterized C2H2 Zn-finger protein
MPKLSKHSLEKMFPCPYCGVLFRTRQGLSGHIQFKHQPPQKNIDAYEKKALGLAKKIRVWKQMKYGQGQSLPKHIHEQGLNILQRWAFLLSYFYNLGVELGDNDFKNFFIHNFGVSYSIIDQETLLALQALKFAED